MTLSIQRNLYRVAYMFSAMFAVSFTVAAAFMFFADPRDIFRWVFLTPPQDLKTQIVALLGLGAIAMLQNYSLFSKKFKETGERGCKKA